jgi:hypothetical protein
MLVILSRRIGQRLTAATFFARHPGEGRDPVPSVPQRRWIPAFAGMTVGRYRRSFCLGNSLNFAELIKQEATALPSSEASAFVF